MAETTQRPHDTERPRESGPRVAPPARKDHDAQRPRQRALRPLPNENGARASQRIFTDLAAATTRAARVAVDGSRRVATTSLSPPSTLSPAASSTAAEAKADAGGDVAALIAALSADVARLEAELAA